MGANGGGATDALIESARGLRWGELPGEVRAVARHCALDALGCAVAGASEPLVEMLVGALEVGALEVGGRGGPGAALVGRSERASANQAALINGAAAHALDYDDTHTTMSGHPTAPVLPALLALAEQEGSSGSALLTALVAGIELECRLGLLLGPGHYAAGFHATGTVGTFGAAAACAHLLALDQERWRHALGLAGTSAAGLKSAFGSMAKPLHAGRAAEAGLLAARLAQRGFTAHPAVVEAEQGFAATHHGRVPAAEVLAEQAGRFFVRETLFKFHAACYLTHAAIEAAGALRARLGGAVAQAEEVTVTVQPSLLSVCNIDRPGTGLEGKFSLKATTAMALLGWPTSDVASFSDQTMASSELVRLRDRVRVQVDRDLPATRARVRIALAGSGASEEDRDTGEPARDLAAQQTRIAAKFEANASPRLSVRRAAHACVLVLALDQQPSLEPLLTALRPG